MVTRVPLLYFQDLRSNLKLGIWLPTSQGTRWLYRWYIYRTMRHQRYTAQWLFKLGVSTICWKPSSKKSIQRRYGRWVVLKETNLNCPVGLVVDDSKSNVVTTQAILPISLLGHADLFWRNKMAQKHPLAALGDTAIFLRLRDINNTIGSLHKHTLARASFQLV